MPVKVLSKKCARCHASFFTYDEKKNYCNSECLWKNAYEVQRGIKKEIQETLCAWCGRSFAPNRNSIYCDRECRKMKINADNEKKYTKDSLKKVKSRRAHGNVTYSELNRRSEYNRLYDDYYVNGIIRGKFSGG